jgi:hypothetical protein
VEPGQAGPSYQLVQWSTATPERAVQKRSTWKRQKAAKPSHFTSYNEAPKYLAAQMWAHNQWYILELYSMTEVRQYSKHLILTVLVETCSAPVMLEGGEF